MEQDLSGDDPHGLENLSPFRVVGVSLLLIGGLLLLILPFIPWGLPFGLNLGIALLLLVLGLLINQRTRKPLPDSNNR